MNPKSMTWQGRSLLVLSSGLFAWIPAARPAAAQTDAVVEGRVADATDVPLDGAVVVLHAVGETAGVELDRDTADAEGRFRLAYRHEDGMLYFVATRIGQDIFMAEPFRDPVETDLVLRAGAGVEPLRMGAPSPSTAPLPAAVTADATTGRARHAGWWVAAIGLFVVGLVALLVHRSRYQAPRARELMVEIARLDERLGGAPDPTGHVRRESLRKQLVEALELDDDAARH